jgi:hypothetical protein
MVGRRSNSGKRGGVLSSWTPTASGMVLQCPGWRHRADDEGDVPHWFDITVSSREGTIQASIPFRGFHRPLSRVRRAGRTRVGGTVSRSRHWPHRTVTCSGGDDLTGRVSGTAPIYDSQAVSEGRHGVDSSLSQAPALCQNIKCSSRESGCGSCEPARASSEAEAHSRGVQPSSEAKPHPRGCPALERGGVSPEGTSSPRARRSLGDMVVYPSSEAEFHPRGAGADRFGGTPRSLRAVGPCHRAVIVLGVIHDL